MISLHSFSLAGDWQYGMRFPNSPNGLHAGSFTFNSTMYLPLFVSALPGWQPGKESAS